MARTSKKIIALSLAIATGVLTPTPAHAWGERGHQIVTRVAVRLLAARVARGTALANQFGRKEFMLGHLSNVPDIVWRNQGEAIENMNAPTHFLDLEYVAPTLRFAETPRALAAAVARMKQLCAAPPRGYVCPVREGSAPDENSAGTAPWRVGQLFRLTVESLKKAHRGDKINSSEIDRAFLVAGLMSHFVGDLGNPYHSTRNYDGWESGQGGVHSYFEGAMVNTYRLDLDQEVFEAALAGKGLPRVLKQIDAAEGSLAGDPVALALALAYDSHSRLDAANAIDRKFAVVKPSGVGAEGRRFGAERRDASELRPKFHDLIVERLATSAEALANLWLLAWEEAGRPDFKGYQSFAYPVGPDFIPADYLTGTR